MQPVVVRASAMDVGKLYAAFGKGSTLRALARRSFDFTRGVRRGGG